MNEHLLVSFSFAFLYLGILCFALVGGKQRPRKNRHTEKTVDTTLPLDRAQHDVLKDLKQDARCLLVEFSRTTVACRAQVKNTMPLNVNRPHRLELENIVVHDIIGRGHFKTVYRGTWHSYAVAMSVMKTGGIHTEARLQRQIALHPHLLTCYA